MKSALNMRSLFLGTCLLVVGIGFSNEAKALIDLRLGYGQNSFTADSMNTSFKEDSLAEFKSLSGISADVLVSPPLFPIGLGLRYEAFAGKGSTTTGDTKFTYTRTSLLINRRLIDTLIYLGPIVSLGFSNKASITVTPSATGIASDFTAKSSMTGSVGVEGGVQLMPFRVGAELGYNLANLGEVTDSDGAKLVNNAGENVKIDLSGIYMKALVGIGF